MNILCIASKKDIAAINIAQFLKNKLRIKYIEEEAIFQDLNVTADMVIYLSRHKSKSKKPTLTAHPIGNYGKAKYGGKDHTLMPVNSLVLKTAIRSINKNAKQMGLRNYYDVTLEVTHHGPSINVPTLFVEVGSSEAEWRDLKACKCIANAVLDIKNHKDQDMKSALFFGGNHYSSKATTIMLEEDIAIGHMCPKYARKWLTVELIQEMVRKTKPSPEIAIIDKKGVSAKTELMQMLEKLNLEIILT